MKFCAKWNTYSSQSCLKILASISEMRTLKFSACSWAFPISFGWEEFEFFPFLRNFSNLSFQKNSFSFHPMSRTHLTKAPNSQSKATRMYSVGSSCHGHPKLSVWKPLSPLLLCLQRDLKCHHCIRQGHKTGRILQHAYLWNGKPPPKKENTWAFFFLRPSCAGRPYQKYFPNLQIECRHCLPQYREAWQPIIDCTVSDGFQWNIYVLMVHVLIYHLKKNHLFWFWWVHQFDLSLC